MVGKVLTLLSSLLLCQVIAQQDSHRLNTEVGIQQWVSEKYQVILDSHKPLQDKTAELGSMLNNMASDSGNVKKNVAKWNIGLCPRGIQMNVMAEGQAIQCLAEVAARGAATQVETQMHCFQVMKEYGDRVIGLGGKMASCAGDTTCTQNLVTTSVTYEAENHELVSQKLNHVWEAMNTLNGARQKCIQRIVDTANSASASCGSWF